MLLLCIDVVLYMLTSVSVPPSVGSQGLLLPSRAPGIRLRGWGCRWSVSQVVVRSCCWLLPYFSSLCCRSWEARGGAVASLIAVQPEPQALWAPAFLGLFTFFLLSHSLIWVSCFKKCVSIFNKLLKHFFRTKIS